MNTTEEVTLPHSVRFAEKWVEWIQYRKDIKKSYKTQKAITMALNQLKAVSEQEACEMIDNSIRNEYQGIFPVKRNPNKPETPLRVTWNKNKPPNEYDRKDYDRSLAIAHMRTKIEAFCKSDTPSPIQDMGFIYTNLLTERCGMVVPEAVKQQIEAEVTEEANTPRRNRFEPEININIKTECRDRELFWWLSEQKKNGIRIYKSI